MIPAREVRRLVEEIDDILSGSEKYEPVGTGETRLLQAAGGFRYLKTRLGFMKGNLLSESQTEEYSHPKTEGSESGFPCCDVG